MWFLLSLGSAFLDSVKDAYSKKSVAIHDEYVVSYAQRFFKEENTGERLTGAFIILFGIVLMVLS